MVVVVTVADVVCIDVVVDVAVVVVCIVGIVVEVAVVVGNNKVSGQLENFFRWNPSGTFRNIPWHHWNNPKKVPGAPSQGFLKFLVFVKNVTKFKNWLSRPHFLANFQLS